MSIAKVGKALSEHAGVGENIFIQCLRDIAHTLTHMHIHTNTDMNVWMKGLSHGHAALLKTRACLCHARELDAYVGGAPVTRWGACRAHCQCRPLV